MAIIDKLPERLADHVPAKGAWRVLRDDAANALRVLLDGALRRIALDTRSVTDAISAVDAGAVKLHLDRMRHSLTLATTAYHQLEPSSPEDPEFAALIVRYEELSQAAQPVLAAGLALLARPTR